MKDFFYFNGVFSISVLIYQSYQQDSTREWWLMSVASRSTWTIWRLLWRKKQPLDPELWRQRAMATSFTWLTQWQVDADCLSTMHLLFNSGALHELTWSIRCDDIYCRLLFLTLLISTVRSVDPHSHHPSLPPLWCSAVFLSTLYFTTPALVGLTLQSKKPIFERLALVTPCIKPLGVPPIARAAIRYSVVQHSIVQQSIE